MPFTPSWGLSTSSSDHFKIIFSALSLDLTAAVRASTPIIRILRAAVALHCAPKHLLAGLSSSPSQPAFLWSVLAFPLVAGFIYPRGQLYTVYSDALALDC